MSSHAIHEIPVLHINTSHANYGGTTQMRTYALPLNSKRLTAINLKCIAQALELPTSSSLDEIRTLVDGKLTELGREPRNIQVQVQASGMIELVDAEGIFLQIEEELPPLSLTSEESDGDSPDDGADLQALKKALCDAETSQDALKVEVTRLTAEVERLSRRCKELWRLTCNCSQMAEFDELLSAKMKKLQLCVN